MAQDTAETETETKKNREKDSDELRTRLLGETATAPWRELQRFFAQGLVLAAAEELDLIDVGVVLATDDTRQFVRWREKGLLDQVSDDQAALWHDSDARLWAMVVKPWVVVQPLKTVAVDIA